MKTSSNATHSQQLGLSMLGNSSQTGVPPTNRGYLLTTVPHFTHLDGMRVSKYLLSYIYLTIAYIKEPVYFTFCMTLYGDFLLLLLTRLHIMTIISTEVIMHIHVHIQCH